MKISLDRDTSVPERLQSLESSVVAVSRQRPSVASLVSDDPAWLATAPERLQSIESAIAVVSVFVL